MLISQRVLPGFPSRRPHHPPPRLLPPPKRRRIKTFIESRPLFIQPASFLFPLSRTQIYATGIYLFETKVTVRNQISLLPNLGCLVMSLQHSLQSLQEYSQGSSLKDFILFDLFFITEWTTGFRLIETSQQQNNPCKTQFPELRISKTLSWL